jgi:hypothetical protein
MRKEETTPKFDLGRVVATPGALEALEEAKTNGVSLLARHIMGDWGDLSKHDKRENDFSVKAGYRIFSAYILSTGVKLWVITEANRSSTTLLLPSEY